MWIAKKENWAPNQTPLERLMIERIVQRCDYNEIISEKHRTTNGYTLVNELISVCETTEKKYKSLYTLLTLIEESKDKNLSQNIKNDIIIEKYFSDLKKYITTDFKPSILGTPDNIKLHELRNFKHNLKLYKHQLDEHYFECLKKEIIDLDFNVKSDGYATEANKLCKLIDILITFLVHKGYSVSSFYELIMRWLNSGYRITPKAIFRNFNFANRSVFFVHRFTGKKNEIIEDFAEILTEKFKLKITFGKVSEVENEHLKDLNFSATDYVIIYKTTTLDPHSYVRSLYDEIIKQIISRKNRTTLVNFNYFFKNTYWKLTSKSAPKIQPIKLNDDPINLLERKNTLLKTLENCPQEINFHLEKKKKLPYIENKQLNNAIFYYNMAIGSKSIENSFSLLWTSLEAILPYRTESSDIGSIQNFVSNSLAIGAISRDMQSIYMRLHATKKKNPGLLVIFDISEKAKSTDDEILNLFELFMNTTEVQGVENCNELANYSQLLAYQYSKIGKPLSVGKISYIKKRIDGSHQSIKYQLQRIYMHRNQIVHSAEMISEYTNLWSHLEWYVGKLLYYAFIELVHLKSSDSIEDCFRKLESEYKYVNSYLEKNKDNPINSLSHRIKEELFKYNWQSF